MVVTDEVQQYREHLGVAARQVGDIGHERVDHLLGGAGLAAGAHLLKHDVQADALTAPDGLHERGLGGLGVVDDGDDCGLFLAAAHTTPPGPAGLWNSGSCPVAGFTAGRTYRRRQAGPVHWRL